MIQGIVFLVGIGILIVSAELVVAGAAALARRWHVSDLAIGLTIVAFGTSAPELFVSVVAAFRDNAAIAVGNVVGSNICNLLLILGLAAILQPLAVDKALLRGELAFLSVVSAGLLFFAGRTMGMAAGGVFMALFVWYLRACFRHAPQTSAGSGREKTQPGWRIFLCIAVGLVGLPVGARLLLRAAVGMAQALGVSQELIGLTVVAVGTSLPEMATSLVAAGRNNAAVSVGNLLGSNIFNVLFVLGTAALIRPLVIPAIFMPDMIFILCCGGVVAVMVAGRRYRLTRANGAVLVVLYVTYLFGVILRR